LASSSIHTFDWQGKKLSRQKTFTRTELESAKQMLADLPDLKQDKISQDDLLESLKDELLLLTNQKGYSKLEIKKVLADLGLNVTAKKIAELLAPVKRSPGRRKAASE
jgi:hypothetical protein